MYRAYHAHNVNDGRCNSSSRNQLTHGLSINLLSPFHFMITKQIDGIICGKCLKPMDFSLQDILAGRKSEHSDCIPVKIRKPRGKNKAKK